MSITGEALERAQRDLDFRDELASLINRHSRENASDTPDFILASFLMGCLAAWDQAVGQRDDCRGHGVLSALTAKAEAEGSGP